METIDTVKAIDTLRTVLQGMIQEPIYENSPSGIIGEKTFKMYIQRPIVEGESRKKIESKLFELIDKL